MKDGIVVASPKDRVERMDNVAATLLKIVESTETTEVQKGRLFTQAIAWFKVRPSLRPLKGDDTIQGYIDRMDEVANKILLVVEDEKTSEVQKGRLFAVVLSWHKVRETLKPPEEGTKLKEMERELTTGHKRNGSSRQSGHSARTSAAAKGIQAIISKLPKYGEPKAAGRPNNGDVAGDQEGTKFKGGGADSHDRGDSTNILGDGKRNGHVSGDSSIL